VQIGLQRVNRRFDNQLDANGRGKMINGRGLGNQVRQFRASGNFRSNDAQAGVPRNGAQIFQAAGGKIINDNHLLSFFEQPFDQVRTNETSPAGDEDVASAVKDFRVHGGCGMRIQWSGELFVLGGVGWEDGGLVAWT